MKNRRQLISSLTAGVTTKASTTRQPNRGESTEGESCECCGSAKRDSGDKVFPDVPVVTHEGQQAVFYRDLIRGKTVLLNFMSIVGDKTYPVTQNLAQVQRLLGQRLGHEVFMYSVTVDPEHDTPALLRAFARTYGAGPGWWFLTGERKSIDLVRNSFFIHHAGHQHQQAHGPDCSLGVARYGNDAVGTWGSVATRTSPQWIVERLNWVQPRPIPSGRPRRKGPQPLPARLAARATITVKTNK